MNSNRYWYSEPLEVSEEQAGNIICNGYENGLEIVDSDGNPNLMSGNILKECRIILIKQK